LGVLGAIVVVLVAWRGVAFQGKTFDPSATVAGVNGDEPPTGVAAPGVSDPYRIDRGASSWQTTPWAEVTHRELGHATLPLWNPYEGAGTPLAANMQSAVFDPLMIGVHIKTTPLMWDVTYLFIFIAASVATYMFLRMLDLEVVASFAGAAAYSLCGYFVINNNNSFVRTYAYIPVLLLAVDLVTRSGKVRWVALLGASIAATILSGMPESAFFCLAFAGFYALYRLIVAPWKSFIPCFLRLGSGGILGLALSAPLIVMFMEYLPLSATVHSPGVGLGSVSGLTVLNWLFPLLNGAPAGLYAGLSADRSWSGTAVLALALVAVSAFPSSRRWREAWLFFGVAVVVVLKMHGYPGVQWLGMLPISNLAVWPAFAPPVANFSLAVAAAIGVDAIARGHVHRLLLVFVAGVVIVLVRILYLMDRVAWHTIPYDITRHFLFIGVGAGAIVWIGTFVSVSFPQLRRYCVFLASVAVILELFYFVPNDNFPVRADPYQPPRWLTLMDPVQPTDRVFSSENFFYPNTAGALGFQDIRTLDAMYVKRYWLYVRNFITPTFTDRFTGEGMAYQDIVGNRMFDLLGVRYIIAASALPPAVASEGMRLTPLGMKDGAFIYRNENVISRVFVADKVHSVEGMTAAVSYLQSLGHPLPNGTTRTDQFDPSRMAVVETEDGRLPEHLRDFGISPTAPRAATILSYGPDRVEVQVPAGSPGLLVLTDTFYPGWKATVNGKSAPILPADISFRGVVLGPEESTVLFRYEPGSGILGWAIALVGLFTIVTAGFIQNRTHH